MKIAHEAPLSFASKVQKITDYDYCLVHLTDDPILGEEYTRFFKDALKKKREVLLDNSIFELGVAFDKRKFLEKILDIKPTRYIVPDVLEDEQGTKDSLIEWLDILRENKSRFGDYHPQMIGVIQGKSEAELINCYEFMDRYCDCIAISFDYTYFLNLGKGVSPEEIYMTGRQKFIDNLIEKNIINRSKPHHLLGTYLPQEVKHYIGETYNFIYSIDTSNPVVHGLLGIRYSDRGLSIKLKTPLYKLIRMEYDIVPWKNVRFNIEKYRNFAGLCG